MWYHIFMTTKITTAEQMAEKIKRTHYSKESDFQRDVLRFLRLKGCFCLKLSAGPGVPTATPDIFFAHFGFYGFAELKLSKRSRLRPGQKEMVEKLNRLSYAKIIYPENFSELEEDLWDLRKED